jgi:hypothetical protein
MKLSNLLLIYFGIIFSCNACSEEFIAHGVRLEVPSGFNEINLDQPKKDGYSVHSFVRKINGKPVTAIHVYITVLTDEQISLGVTLTKNPALLASQFCLVVAINDLRGVMKNLLIAEGHEISLSGKIGSMVVVSGIADTPRDKKFGIDKTLSRIYCVSEPSREIQFHIHSFNDQPADLVNEAIRSIDGVVITDK